MTMLTAPDALLSISVQKRYARPSECGFQIYGYSQFGDEAEGIAWQPCGKTTFGDTVVGNYMQLSGVYQQRTLCCYRPPEPGQRRYNKGTIRMKYYQPTNKRTIPQQANRMKFADAIDAWQVLTEDERWVYHTNAVGTRMTGYNLFIRIFMLS